MKQTILVTGASSGFGLLVANQLHKKGYYVIGTSRNPEKIQSQVSFKVLALDLDDDNSIIAFGKELFKHISQLDVLINNAGFFVSGLAEEISIELGRKQMETNFWGTVKVTNEILPYFRKQGFGKIITVGSITGLFALPTGSYYAASKHAVEGYFKALRFELNPFNIKVTMVEPMGFKTNIINSSVAGQNKISDYDEYRKKAEAFSKKEFDNAPEPTPVIDKLLQLVEEKNPTFNHPIGKGASIFVTLQHFAYKTFENAINKRVNSAK